MRLARAGCHDHMLVGCVPGVEIGVALLETGLENMPGILEHARRGGRPWLARRVKGRCRDRQHRPGLLLLLLLLLLMMLALVRVLWWEIGHLERLIVRRGGGVRC